MSPYMPDTAPTEKDDTNTVPDNISLRELAWLMAGGIMLHLLLVLEMWILIKGYLFSTLGSVCMNACITYIFGVLCLPGKGIVRGFAGGYLIGLLFVSIAFWLGLEQS